MRASRPAFQVLLLSFSKQRNWAGYARPVAGSVNDVRVTAGSRVTPENEPGPSINSVDDARWEAAEILALLPDFSLARERERRQYAREKDMEWYIEGLRRAGLPQ